MGRMSLVGLANLLARVSSWVVTIGGTIVLLGWALNAEPVESILPGWPKMSPLTALDFVFVGMSARWAIRRPVVGKRASAPGDARRKLSFIAGAVAMALSLVRLGIYSFGLRLNYDLLFFHETPGHSPAVQAPATALCFFVFAFALLLAESSRFRHVFLTLSLLGSLIAWLGLSHYVFGGASLLPYSQMALHTAILFLILGDAVLGVRTDQGLMALLISPNAGGMIARRMVPAALAVPLVFGWICLQGQHAGLYGAEAGASLFALANVIIFGSLIWAHAAILDRADGQRQLAEREVHANRELLKAVTDNSPAVIYVKGLDGRYLLINRRYEQLFHVSREEMTGKTDYDLFSKESADAFRRVDQEVVDSERAIEAEEVAPLDDGPHTYMSVKYPLHDAGGRLYAVCGISTDITERKRVEAALHKSEERFRAFLTASSDVIYRMSADWSEMRYLDGKDFISDTKDPSHAWLEKYIYPEDQEFVLANIRAAIRTKSIFDLEHRVVRKDGTVGWTLSRAIPLLDSNGEIVEWFGAAGDITERKRAEAALRESESRTRAMVEGALDAIIAMDHEGRITEFNPAAERIFGSRKDEVIDRSVGDVIIPASALDAHRNGLARYLATGEGPMLNKRIELMAVRSDQAEFPVELSISRMPGDGLPMFTGFLRDITERKRAEEERQKFVSLVEQSGDFIAMSSVDGHMIYVNPAGRELVGADCAQVSSMSIRDIHPDEWWSKLKDNIYPNLINGGGNWIGEAQICHAGTRQQIDVQMNVFPINDQATGRVLCLASVMRDITAKKAAAAKLEAQLMRLDLLSRVARAIGERQDLESVFRVVVRALEESLPIDFACICLYNQTTNVLTVTSVGTRSLPLARQLAMLSQSEIPIDQNGLAKCVNGQLVYEPDTSLVTFPFPKKLASVGLSSLVATPLLLESTVFGVLLAARREPHGFSSADCDFLRQLSEHVALAAHHAQLYENLQHAYDDLRQTQLAVMQQERLRALGQMASGIAHDINNTISPVALYAELLLERETNLTVDGREHLRTIGRAIEDVAETVSRMREFFRQREAQTVLAPVRMNLVIGHVLELARPRWRDMPQERGTVLQLKTELAQGLPEVMGAESEIRDALLNLIINATDAMPAGGTLYLRTRAVPSALGVQVCVEVEDTGSGMDEEARRRCLEPFFTTKGERGTGLGLAMVYGTLQRHNAEIEIESQPARGTLVRLIFPASVPGSVGLATEPPVMPVPRCLRLLIIDDDPILIKSLRDTLEADGHVVSTADGGQAGISAFLGAKDRNTPFQVVITDLGMPHVDGRQVAATVKSLSPETAVILLTGWGQRLSIEKDVPAHVDRLIGKPPKLQELRRALAEVSTSSLPQ